MQSSTQFISASSEEGVEHHLQLQHAECGQCVSNSRMHRKEWLSLQHCCVVLLWRTQRRWQKKHPQLASSAAY